MSEYRCHLVKAFFTFASKIHHVKRYPAFVFNNPKHKFFDCKTRRRESYGQNNGKITSLSGAMKEKMRDTFAISTVTGKTAVEFSRLIEKGWPECTEY